MEAREERMTQRVQDLARRITAWNESAGKSMAWLVRKYDMLGSPKTLRDMREGRVEGYNLEQQLANYEAAWSLIGGDDPASKQVALLTGLTSVVQIKRAVLECMQSSGIDRVILLLGDSGTGKTCALKALAAEYDTAMIVECLEVWGDSPSAMLSDILDALGEKEKPSASAYSLFRSVVTRLCKQRVTLCLDEAHQLGPRCCNTIKGLINATPGEFVLAGQPTLWTLLQGKAHIELRQITTNRLHERISIGLNLKDVAVYIENLLPDMGKAEVDAAAKIVAERAANLGNMAFVRDCCASASRKAEDRRKPDAGEWAKAVVALAAKK